jgi:hypothetical protein
MRFTALTSLWMIIIASGLSMSQNAAASDYFVLSNSGGGAVDNKPVAWGMAVSDDATIKLPAKSSLTLLGEAGKVILNGVFEGALGMTPGLKSSTSDSSTGILTRLLIHSNLFAQRGDGFDQPSGGLWSVRLDAAGAKCISGHKGPSLNWDISLNGSQATIENPGRDSYVKVLLSGGQIVWPPSLPVVTTSEYRVSIDGTGRTVTWKLIEIGVDQPIEAVLQAMAEKQCVGQLLSYAVSVPPTINIQGQGTDGPEAK